MMPKMSRPTGRLTALPAHECDICVAITSKGIISMRSPIVATVALLAMTAMPVLAQTPSGLDSATGARPGHEPGIGTSLPLSDKASNIEPSDTRSIIAPTLPSSSLGANATARDYLTAARAALAAGRTGQAQQSLEMAETRALDRSVVQGQESQPNDSQFISRIGEARRALGEGDRARAIAIIDLALSS